jgi:hypothetical protein
VMLKGRASLLGLALVSSRHNFSPVGLGWVLRLYLLRSRQTLVRYSGFITKDFADLVFVVGIGISSAMKRCCLCLVNRLSGLGGRCSYFYTARGFSL